MRTVRDKRVESRQVPLSGDPLKGIRVEQVRVIVEHRGDLPAGVPALWEEASSTLGERSLRLYLREGMDQSLADHFRCLAVRSVWPAETFDRFTVTPAAKRIIAVA